MNLFQKPARKKYLSELDSTLIDAKYTSFREYFSNSERQENIHSSREEQFQEGFLRALFVHIVEYTLNPLKSFIPSNEEQEIIIQKIDELMKGYQFLENGIYASKSSAKMLMQAVLKEAFEG